MLNGYASPPCLAHEIDPTYFGILSVDPQQALDVARWRRAERTRLLAERAALSATERDDVAGALSGHVKGLTSKLSGVLEGKVISAYWPIKGELDLRPVMAEWYELGAIVVLPVVEKKASPLVFRCWMPETRMVRGAWNIPVPPPEAEQMAPDIVLAPVIGWACDDNGTNWRLGYGGGYFDRTLALLRPRPLVIGVGLRSARLATIFPQPHDVALDALITEAGQHEPTPEPG